jgi:hypothetical protein
VRTVLLVCLTILLLAMVALASRGFEADRSGLRSGSTSAPLIPGAAEYLLVMAFAGAIGATLLFGFALAKAARRRKKPPDEVVTEPPRPPWWSGPFVILLAAGAIALPIVLLVWTGGIHRQSESRPAEEGPGSPAQTVAPTEQSQGSTETAWTDWGWTPVAVVAGVGIAVVLLAVVSRARRRPPALTVNVQKGGIAKAIGETIEDIRSDPDPRNAIISAYALMERILAANGWGRRPSRAPFEYLEEFLHQLAVPSAPASSLTALFEIAKFSRHRVDGSMKELAIDALVAVRRSLEGTAS